MLLGTALDSSRRAYIAAEPAQSSATRTSSKEQIIRQLAIAEGLTPVLNAAGAALDKLAALKAQSPRDEKALRSEMTTLHRSIESATGLARNVSGALEVAETYLGKKAGKDEVDALRRRLDVLLRDAEEAEALEDDVYVDFDVQKAMSEFRQAEELAAAVQKKTDETSKGVRKKVD
jgi:hypothetical protein